MTIKDFFQMMNFRLRATYMMNIDERKLMMSLSVV